MNKPLAYIIDLDGTLYDNSHRQHLIPADRSNTAGWVEFNCACTDDVLREDMSDLVRSILLSGREVIFLTGRGEAAREPTMQRLLKDFNFIEQPTLIMRPMDCHTSAAEFKRDAVKRIRDSERWAEYDLIALEDDPSIVEVMRGMGVTVLQIDSKCCALQSFGNTEQLDTAPAQFESLAGEPVSEPYKLTPHARSAPFGVFRTPQLWLFGVGVRQDAQKGVPSLTAKYPTTVVNGEFISCELPEGDIQFISCILPPEWEGKVNAIDCLFYAPEEDKGNIQNQQQYDRTTLLEKSVHTEKVTVRFNGFCHIHRETPLIQHPFMMLMSYPPKPYFYCPKCDHGVSEWSDKDHTLKCGEDIFILGKGGES